MNKTGTQQGRSAGALWIVQAISGLLLILLLGLHMVAQHFVAEGGIRDFQAVIAYISNPIVFLIEVVFLIVVTTHAMLGLRAVLLDTNPGQGLRQAVNWGVTLLGGAALIYGIWLAIQLQSMAV
ncbi:MAG: succinate dehydrogenase, cytochrome b556 subunit [Anaerolineae bacterium]